MDNTSTVEDTEQTPVHVFIDCGTHEVTHIPLTDEELSAQKERLIQQQQEEQRQAQEEESLRQMVQSHPDPLVRALAQRLGIKTG